MPTYEYICKNCGEPTEHFASMSARPLKKCPHCGKNQLERQIGTGAGFIFKGGGFYETDYRSEGYKKAAKEDRSPTAGSKKAEGGDAGSKDGSGSGSSQKSEDAGGKSGSDTGKPTSSDGTSAGKSKPSDTSPPAKPKKGGG